MVDTEPTVQTDSRHWSDSTDLWQTLNWQHRLMADTELTLQTDGRHWTLWFSFDSYYPHDYFLISYFHRIPFGFIFPLSVIWCSFVNFLSQFATTRVLLCCDVLCSVCVCVLYVRRALDYLLQRIEAVMNEIQYAEFVWALVMEQVTLDTESALCW